MNANTSPIRFQASAEIQTEWCGSTLTAVEERSEKTTLSFGNATTTVKTLPKIVSDFKIVGNVVSFVDQEGLSQNCQLRDLSITVTDTTAPLKESDRRAQRRETRKLTWQEYVKLIEPMDLSAGQFLMLCSPRDARMTSIKILHDYGVKCVLPKVTKVYYDLETACFNSNQVPQHTDRNAFITCIGAVVQTPDGLIVKHVFLNNTLRYEMKLLDADIAAHVYPTETQCVQGFFRFLHDMSQNSAVVCIGHNASANPRGQPYDLPWLISRSNFNLQVTQKVYRDKYTATEGVCYHNLGPQFPNIYFADSMKEITNKLAMEKAKLASLSLDSLAEFYKLTRKSGDMTYKELARISTSFQSEFGRVASYCVNDCVMVQELDTKLSLIDQRLSLVEKCNVPISHALNATYAQSLAALIMLRYRQQGYVIPYNIHKQEDVKKFKGAFTSVDHTIPVGRIALQPDIASQYPSAIQALSLSHESIRYPGESLTNAKQLSITDEEEEAIVYYYEQSPSNVLPSLVYEWKEARLIGKARKIAAKAAAAREQDPQKKIDLKKEEQIAELMDLGNKTLLNTLYGLLGSPSFPLYDRALGQSVTAYGRQTIEKAREIITNMGGILLASDTDSVSYAPRPEVNCPTLIEQEINQLNQKIAEAMDTTFMTFAIEEVIVPNDPTSQMSFINFSRKSYMMTYVKEVAKNKYAFQDGTEWLGVDSRGPCFLKQRGFVTGQFTKPVRQRLEKHLLSLFDPTVKPLDLINQVYQDEYARLSAAVQSCDVETLAQYAKTVKNGGSSQLAQYLQNTFNLQDNYIQIIFTKGIKRSQCALPLQLINVQNIRQVDIAHHALSISSALLKVVKIQLSAEELASVPKKVSATKQKILDICEDLQDDAILVRLEKSSGKTRRYEFFQTPYYAYKAQRENCAYHEIISSPIIRYFCDIDHATPEMFTNFLRIAQDLFQSAFAFPVRINYLHNPMSKGYHVYFNVSCHLELAKFLADRINALMGVPDFVDLAPYAMFKSLRLPNCPKIALDGTVSANSRYNLPENAQIQDYLITCTIGTMFIKSPLHIQQSLPIDDYLQFGIKQAGSPQLQKVQEYVHNTLKCPDAVLRAEDNKVVIIFGTTRPVCPYHKRVHENENMYARMYSGKESNGLTLYCYRETQGEVKFSDRVTLVVDQVPENKIQEIQREAIALQQPLLADAIPTEQRYVDLIPIARDARTIFLRSHLGTGKTEAVMRLILEKNYKKVLYLSFRKTFTQSLAARFASVGKILSYSDQRGSLYHTSANGEHSRMIICQIEALARYQDTCDLLVVDEWESILSQMNSNYALSTSDVVEALRRVFTTAQQCIVMDGFLQQTSADIFNHITGNEQQVTQQNMTQPFADHTATVTISSKHNDNLKTIFQRVDQTFKSGGKSCCFVTSNAQSEQLELLLQQQCTGIKVKRYHGDSTKLDENGLFHADNKRRDMEDVNAIAAACDVLIYTSTITAGISIDQTPFQYLCAYLHENTCDPLAFVQGIHRVRCVTSKHIDVFVNNNFNQAVYQSPRTVSPIGYDVVLSKSLKEQVLVWLTAREACLNACQQWVVVALLKQMGYQLTIGSPDEEQRVRKEEAKALSHALKTVKEQARNGDYCDFSEGISDECLRVFEAIKNRGAQTDEATATRLANQMRCLTTGFAAGLNPQEINDLPAKIEAIRALVKQGMLSPQGDDNKLIANYLSTFGDQLKFRKQIAKISAMGLEPTTQGFEDTLKHDIQDRSTMGVANKTINVAEINKQMEAVRTAAKIDITSLPVGQDFNMHQHFEALIEELKSNKDRTPLVTIDQALAIMGFLCKSDKRSTRVNGKVCTQKFGKLAKMP